MVPDPIELTLVVEPRRLSMSGRDAFRVGFVATNRGSATVDPGLSELRLFIDGRDSLHWADAIANGHRDAHWFALPPDKAVSMSWLGMGKLLFPVPGDYSLALHRGDRDTPPVVVQVVA